MPSGRFASRDRGTAQTGRETSDLHSHAKRGNEIKTGRETSDLHSRAKRGNGIIQDVIKMSTEPDAIDLKPVGSKFSVPESELLIRCLGQWHCSLASGKTFRDIASKRCSCAIPGLPCFRNHHPKAYCTADFDFMISTAQKNRIFWKNPVFL